ncbi:glycosyltransferase [Isoptericola sp. AK164]|uniref:glycosyltransferase n=1 Tax=Isoptericola sp. AK164 TaxID=3024246 RepID=UPI0024184C25|nr:glycosyltransferase [Isoptericola sp. AK164]
MSFKQAIDKSRERYSRAVDFESHAFWRSRPIVPGTVLYESFSGNGMLCNPRAVFEMLLEDPAYRSLTHVWALDSTEAIDAARSRWPDRVRFVLKESRAYYRALATSQYLVNNATFPPQFSKREGQTYLNTWHGTPLKKMGYDMAEGGSSSRNIVRNFVMADYLVSSSPFMTEQMYAAGYKLRGIFRGEILESGQPRTDVQLTEGAGVRARRQLAEAGLDVEGRRVVLYAPTWRGSFYAPADETKQLLEVVESLQTRLGDAYRVLLKTHQVAYGFARSSGSGRDVVVPNDIPTNVVLSATDLLVTDYSSIFFDVLPTRTPIVHFAPDAAHYGGARGLYEDLDALPGPVATTRTELGEAVLRLAEEGLDGLEPDRRANYDRFVATYAPHDDGGATRRVVDTVFGGRPAGVVHRDLDDDGRTSLLVYLGGLRSNGITTSVLNLLSAIDPDRYDVSAFYGPPQTQDEMQNEARIPSTVRLFPRVGGFNGSKRLRNARRALFNGLDQTHSRVSRQRMQPYFEDEWHRCFGDSRFDHVVDFSGYGPMWPNILLAAPTGHKSIWLHNDVLADAQREVDGKRNLEQLLHAVFSTYDRFDSLVSVSEELARINASKLSDRAPAEKFTYARNLMDAERVRRMAGTDVDGSPRRPVGPDERLGKDLVTDLHTLSDLYGAHRVDEAWTRQQVVRAAFGHRKGTRFITMGRLSPEKNHARLVQAFATVVAAEPDSQLAILGGGPLLPALEKQVASLGLQDNVRLTGFQPNPYAALGEADCFVLSSDYEGQPMVILEARTLGVPVITTEFGSAKGALADDEGLRVPRDADALAQGMLTFIRSGVPQRPFDTAAYNREALREFFAAVGATGRGH